jgi:homoserine kinase type II
VESPQRRAVGEFLSGYGIRPAVLNLTRLTGGEDNLNLRVDADGAAYVLRRYDITPPAEVAFELELLAYLAEHGFPTPPPLRRRDGGWAGRLHGRPAALFPHVDGRHPHGRPLWAGERIAAALADLHRLTSALSDRGIRTRTDGHRLRTLRARLGERPALPAFRPVLAAIDRCLDERAALAGELPAAVVHHDAHAGNALFDGDRHLTALLDFDEAYPDYALTDVGRLLLQWARDPEGQALHPRRAARLLAAYQSRRRLTRAERAALEHFVRFTTLADAADYLLGLLLEDPDTSSPESCHSWALYRLLEADPSWCAALTR